MFGPATTGNAPPIQDSICCMSLTFSSVNIATSASSYTSEELKAFRRVQTIITEVRNRQTLVLL
eukprot:31507-Amphidinium_carterae.1